jgi:hypothetical protein
MSDQPTVGTKEERGGDILAAAHEAAAAWRAKEARERAIISAALEVVAAWRADELPRSRNDSAQSAMVRLADALRGYQTHD